MQEILEALKALDRGKRDEIEAWLSQKRKEAPPFFYNSVDLRHSTFKLAPVDTNLYPAGFNNLSHHARARASRLMRGYLVEHFPQAKRLLVIPENHTRNPHYFDNVKVLAELLSGAGYEVRVGHLSAEAGPPVAREGNRLVLDGFIPDVIALNNDLTSGMPPLLAGVVQPVIPPPEMGWWRRRKSIHFTAYTRLADEFARVFGLDPWLITTEFHQCGMVDFKTRAGQECMGDAVEKVLARVRKKYAQYGLDLEPYVFVKADSGTYGMGVMTARSAGDVLDLNKKTRNKMQVVKEGSRVSEVIIQEGIPTVDKVDGKPAEPLVYLIDGVPAGGMYRVNAGRDAYGNLNARGMEFTGMCDEDEDPCGKWKAVEECHFRSFGLIAALAALAVSREDYSRSEHRAQAGG